MPTLDINDTTLFYDELGSGEPIILHHGYTGSHDVWLDEIAPRLADRYRCIVMDARGAADSSHPDAGYNIPQYALDVLGVADALGLDTFTYVGHSMGGGIGYQLGVHHGHRLDRLVLVAPIPAGGIQGDPAMHAEAVKLRADPNARSKMIAQRKLTTLRSSDAAIERGVDRALSVSEGHFNDSWQSMVDFDVSAELDKLTTPTLMVAGAADGLCTPNVNDWQKLPNATLHVFSRVGHGVPGDVPDEFAAMLADFMEHGAINAKTLQERMKQG